MSNVYGADVDELRQLAHTMSQAATQLRGLRTRLDSSVRSSAWSGPDAAHFRSDWHSTNGPRVESAMQLLEDVAVVVMRNANEQEQTSSAAPASTSSRISSRGGDSPSIIGRSGANDIADAAHSVFGTIGAALNSRAQGTPDWFPASVQDVITKIPGIGGLVDAVGIASSMGDGRTSAQDIAVKIAQTAVDTVGGKLRGTMNPPFYLAGVAASVIGDVVVNAGKMDLTSSTSSTTFDYIAKDPGGAALAASQAVVGYLPKLASDFWPW